MSKNVRECPRNVQGMSKECPKKRAIRVEVLLVPSFEELDDLELLKETKEHIQRVADEIKNEKISLQEWCDKQKMSTAVMIDLFKNALPIIRLGGFDGVYEIHLSRVLNQEAQRQLQQQLQDRVCARVLTGRYHANKEAKQDQPNKIKKLNKIKS